MAKQHSTNLAPSSAWGQKQATMPVMHTRTTRPEAVSVVTSGFGGKFVPLKMIPLFREDACVNGMLTVNVQMAETAEMLLNPVRVTTAAFFVPKLAMERFHDMGSIDRSYNSEPEVDGNVIPWFEELPFDPYTSQVHRTLGLHVDTAESNGNTDYLEAYNQVWNYLARQRSNSLTERNYLDSTLAPAFWQHTQMRHVVPNFDDALIEGVVPLTLVNSSIDLQPKSVPLTGVSVQVPVDSTGSAGWSSTAATNTVNVFDQNGDGTVLSVDGNNLTADLNALTGQLAADSVYASLANIDMARETAAWARMRNRYQGLSEEWMMDQLLSGMRITDQSLRQPMLIDESSTVVGMSQRYATDAGNLSKSVADGQTSTQLRLMVPSTPCGGVIVVVAQVLPEQLYERQVDPYLRSMSPAWLPDRLRDELDPQPVRLKTNGEVDCKHTDPAGLFGYEPLNANWINRAPRVGGKYFVDDPTAPWTEVRNRIWDSNVIDPALGPDFYLSTNLSHDVFADSTTDPFEFWLTGGCDIRGLTYFGPAVDEGNDDYDKVLAQVPTDRLKGDGTDTNAAAAE